MKLPACGELRRRLALANGDILQAIIVKHPFNLLDDLLKDEPGIRVIRQVRSHFEYLSSVCAN